MNDVESEDERSILSSNKGNSIYSDWSDLLSVDEEAEYKKTYKSRSEPNTIGVATASAASITKTTKKPSILPVKKTVKNVVLVPYMPKLTDWGSWQIKSPYDTSTIASPPAVQSRKRRRGRIGL